jgi:proline iminopeptidase
MNGKVACNSISSFLGGSLSMKLIFSVVFCITFFAMAFRSEAQEFREGKVSREGFDLYYRITGSGAPIAILSGGPGIDCDYLQPVAREIAKTNQAILIELRGTGRSIPSSINAETVNLKLYLSDLEAVRNQLKIDRWTLLGHSAGGMLAMHYAIVYSEQVDRLVLVGPGAVATRFMNSQNDNVMMRLLPSERKELQNPNLSFGEAVRITMPGNFFDRAKAAEMAAKFNPESIHPEVTKIMIRELMPPDGDIRPGLRGFTRQVLVVTGRQDPLDPGVQYETHLAFPNSTLELIPRCGHFPWIEQPEEFFRILHEFLNTTTAH